MLRILWNILQSSVISLIWNLGEKQIRTPNLKKEWQTEERQNLKHLKKERQRQERELFNLAKKNGKIKNGKIAIFKKKNGKSHINKNGKKTTIAHEDS